MSASSSESDRYGERRYQTAAEALADLTAVEQGLPVIAQATVRAKPLTTREITVKFSLKKVLLPVLVVGALVIVGVVSLINKGGNDEAGRRPGPITYYGAGEPGTRTSGPSVKILPGQTDPGTKSGTPPTAPTGGASAKILSFLGPLSRTRPSYLNEEDSREVERVIATFKEQYPAEAAAFSKYLDGIQVRVRKAHQEREAGNVEASKRSYDRGESEMRKLLAQVNERDRAEKAFLDLQEVKGKIAAAPNRDRPNLLRWLALEKEKDAADAFAKNDFSGARILCGILAKVHTMSLGVEGESISTRNRRESRS